MGNPKPKKRPQLDGTWRDNTPPDPSAQARARERATDSSILWESQQPKPFALLRLELGIPPLSWLGPRGRIAQARFAEQHLAAFLEHASGLLGPVFGLGGGPPTLYGQGKAKAGEEGQTLEWLRAHAVVRAVTEVRPNDET